MPELLHAPQPGRRFDTVVFDLDGTLLDTLPDLVELTNATLRACGFPTHTREEVLSYVGSGVEALIRMAVPQGTPEAAIERASARWKELYPDYGYSLTRPYPGIPEMLDALNHRGMKLAVLSNKFDGAVRDVIEAFLPGKFAAVHGESPDYPRKPDPTGLNRLLAGLGSCAERCIFVGDSSNDVRVAKASGSYSIGVTWGYGSRETLVSDGADLLADNAVELQHALEHLRSPFEA